MTTVSFKLNREMWRNGLRFGGSNSTPKIYKVMNISRKRHPFVAEYIVNGKNLQHVSSQMERSYLRASYENQRPACYCMFKLSTIKVKDVNIPDAVSTLQL